jgi:hypothetical protein
MFRVRVRNPGLHPTVRATLLCRISLAVSARPMHVTHRPGCGSCLSQVLMLARAPKPASSPESRWPQGWRYLSKQYRLMAPTPILVAPCSRRTGPDCAIVRAGRRVFVQSHGPWAILAWKFASATRRSLRQERRHYPAPACSDDAETASADKYLRSLAHVMTPRDGLPGPADS